MDINDQIQDLRKKIDSCDDRIVEILLERFSLSEKIGDLKAGAGVAITDPKRENEIINRLYSLLGGKLEREDIAAIFAPVYQVSKKHQRRK